MEIQEMIDDLLGRLVNQDLTDEEFRKIEKRVTYLREQQALQAEGK